MSRAAGVAVVAVVGAGVGGGVYAAVPDVAVLGLWTVATVTVWWAVSRPLPSTANPAPPAPPERGSDENMQFSVVEGDHPHHWRVEWKRDEA